jgi:hypothetical protein
VVWKIAVVFAAREALFLRCRDQLAGYQQGCVGIMPEVPADSENDIAPVGHGLGGRV